MKTVQLFETARWCPVHIMNFSVHSFQLLLLLWSFFMNKKKLYESVSLFPEFTLDIEQVSMLIKATLCNFDLELWL